MITTDFKGSDYFKIRLIEEEDSLWVSRDGDVYLIFGSSAICLNDRKKSWANSRYSSEVIVRKLPKGFKFTLEQAD